MASDDAYAAFLGQANQDTGARDDISTQVSKFATTKAIDTDVPATLQRLDKYYTSDTDERFEPVSLSWSKSSLPSQDEFRNLIDHSAAAAATAEVEILEIKDFDPKGQYADVLDMVAGAADGGDRKVYRVHHGETRVEYFIVALDRRHSRLVGVRAKAVES